MSYTGHQRESSRITPRCAVVTLSDTRTPETDTSGRLIRELIQKDGGTIERHDLISDDAGPFRGLLHELLAMPNVDCVITTGGTGIARRDQAIDVAAELIDTPLPGFGELFRMLSYEQIRSGAMLSRAVGGAAGGKLLFALPGSSEAVELAMTRLILPELRHLIDQLRK